MGLYLVSSAKSGTMGEPKRNGPQPLFLVQTGTIKAPIRRENGTKSALYTRYAINDPRKMRKASVYPYTVTEPPGVNIHRLRTEADYGLRELSDACVPPITHTTLHRIEQNHGYTQDTLERLAVALTKALGRKIKVADFFLPHEAAAWLEEFRSLPADAQGRITEMIHDTAAAYKYRRRNAG